MSVAPARIVDTRPGFATVDDAFAGDGRREADTELLVDVAGRDTGGAIFAVGAAFADLNGATGFFSGSGGYASVGGALTGGTGGPAIAWVFRGALAAKPVMEGKGVLFKRFDDVDVFDIEVDTLDPDEIIRVGQLIAPLAKLLDLLGVSPHVEQEHVVGVGVLTDINLLGSACSFHRRASASSSGSTGARRDRRTQSWRHTSHDAGRP